MNELAITGDTASFRETIKAVYAAAQSRLGPFQALERANRELRAIRKKLEIENEQLGKQCRFLESQVGELTAENNVLAAGTPAGQLPTRQRVVKIRQCVAAYYSVSDDDILSKRRTSHIIRPRKVAIYLAKTLTLRSLPEIGRYFGGRDHTTILHSVRDVEARMTHDHGLAEEVRDLRGMLGR